MRKTDKIGAVRQGIKSFESKALGRISEKAGSLMKKFSKSNPLDDSLSMFRREKNIGAFSELEVPMQLREVKRIAKDAGIGLDGIKVRIIRDSEMLKRPFTGYTHPKGNMIDLYPNAFMNEEMLVKTLGHERMHVYQTKTFGAATDSVVLKTFEDAAYASENMWWDYYRKAGDFK